MKKRSSVPLYTYRQSSRAEEKAVYRRIAIVTLSTAVILIIVYFWGISFINVLGILRGESNSETETTNNLQIPIQKPTLSSLQTPTNNEKIEIQGTTTPDAKVSLTLNGKKLDGEVIADKSGNFKFSDVTLSSGINQIGITAKNDTGEEMATTSVVLDKAPPSLTITAPANNASFSESTKTVTVSGTTSDTDGIVYVNEIQATIDPKTGNFTFNLPISAGQTEIEIKAFDAAGNVVSQKRTVSVAGSSSTPTPED